MSGNQLVSLGALPSHLANAPRRLNLNAAARANLQASFAVLKIRGKNWRVRYRGDETLIQMSAGTGHDGRPLPEAPVMHVDVVIVGVASAISKKWFNGGYADGESRAPDCFSIDGMSPDPASALKQNTHCATCPQNIWGSVTTESGRKAKACRDGRRIAVVPGSDIANETFGGAMLLDIPPTSLTNLDAYSRQLERNQADMSMVVTRISFNPDVTHQELVFRAMRWVESAEDTALIEEHALGDQVKRMLEEETSDVTADPLVPGERPAHLALVPPRPARPAPAAAMEAETPKPAPEPPPPAPPPAPQPQPVAAKRTAGFAAQPQVAQPQVATQAAPQAAPQALAEAVAAQTTVIQGAPASLEEEIDNLMRDL
jgi:hypothetical protein